MTDDISKNHSENLQNDINKDVYISDFSVILSKIMKDMNITQKSLALQAGINETGVRDMLKGRSKNPRRDTLIRLSRVLGCDPAELISSPQPRLSSGIPDKNRPFHGYQLQGSGLPMARLPLESWISAREWRKGIPSPLDYICLPQSMVTETADCLFVLDAPWNGLSRHALLIARKAARHSPANLTLPANCPVILRCKTSGNFRLAAPHLHPEADPYALVLGSYDSRVNPAE